MYLRAPQAEENLREAPVKWHPGAPQAKNLARGRRWRLLARRRRKKNSIAGGSSSEADGGETSAPEAKTILRSGSQSRRREGRWRARDVQADRAMCKPSPRDGVEWARCRRRKSRGERERQTPTCVPQAEKLSTASKRCGSRAPQAKKFVRGGRWWLQRARPRARRWRRGDGRPLRDPAVLTTSRGGAAGSRSRESSRLDVRAPQARKNGQRSCCAGAV